MSTPRGLEPPSSRLLVGRLVRQLGDARVLDLLEVIPKRPSVLLAGRGRLTDRPLDRVTALTRKPWTLWAMDAAAGTLSPADRALQAAFERIAPGEVSRARANLSGPSVPRPSSPRPAAARPSARPPARRRTDPAA